MLYSPTAISVAGNTECSYNICATVPAKAAVCYARRVLVRDGAPRPAADLWRYAAQLFSVVAPGCNTDDRRAAAADRWVGEDDPSEVIHKQRIKDPALPYTHNTAFTITGAWKWPGGGYELTMIRLPSENQ